MQMIEEFRMEDITENNFNYFDSSDDAIARTLYPFLEFLFHIPVVVHFGDFSVCGCPEKLIAVSASCVRGSFLQDKTGTD